LTPVTLTVGANLIPIVVTSQDGVATNTYTISLTRRSAYQDWALANNAPTNPASVGANGINNLLNFGFSINPSTASGALAFSGTFAGGGTLTATGQPITRVEGSDIRALFVRRDDYAAASLTYTVQFSTDLLNWQTSTVTPTILADDGTNQIVSVPYPAGMNASGFFNVSITMP
jgi:hypothetical protein